MSDSRDPWGEDPGPGREEQEPNSEDPWGDEKPRPDPRKFINQGGPNGSELSSAFKWSFFPILGLSIVSMLGSLFGPFYTLWYLGAIYAAAMALLCLIFGLVAITSRPEERSGAAAAGLLAGVAVGVIALAVTCFANLATFAPLASS